MLSFLAQQPADPTECNAADNQIGRRPPGHVKGHHTGAVIFNLQPVTCCRKPADTPTPELVVSVFGNSEGDPETKSSLYPTLRIGTDVTLLAANPDDRSAPARPLLSICEQSPGVLRGAVNG